MDNSLFGNEKNAFDRSNRYVVPILIIFSVIIILMRAYTFNEPLDRDVACYSMFGQKILQGFTLYKELWEVKPPAVHYTYALAVALFGLGELPVFVLSIFAAISTLIAVYFAAFNMSKSSVGGLFAAGFWTLIWADLTLQANMPNTEVFINLFLTLGFAAFIQIKTINHNFLNSIFSGIFFGLATIYKQNVAIVPVLICMTYLILTFNSKDRIKALVHVLIVGGIIGGMWFAICLFFKVNHYLDEFIADVFTFNLKVYSGGSQFANFYHSLNLNIMFPPYLRFICPLLFMAIFGIVYGFLYGNRSAWMLLLAYMVGAHIAVEMPGRFFPHYYQYWLPIAAIGGGATLGILDLQLKQGTGWVKYVIGFIFAFVLFIHAAPFYQLTPEQWNREKYDRSGEDFVGTMQLGREIKTLLTPNESFFEWGDDHSFYVYSGHMPIIAYFFWLPLRLGLNPEVSYKKFVDSLNNEKPALFIHNKFYYIPPSIVEIINRDYSPLPENADRGKYFLLYRKGSALEARLLHHDSLK